DVTTDALGALLGAVAAAAAERASSRSIRALLRAHLIDVPTFYPVLLAFIVVCVASWEPFDVSIDVGTIVGKLKGLHHDIWQYSVLTDEGISIIHYALLAAAASAWLTALRARRAALIAVVTGVSLAFGLEASQLFITSRMPGLEDAAVSAAGVGLGALLWTGGRRVHGRWGWVALIAVSTAIAAAMEMLSPFTFTAQTNPFAWLPFESYYVHTTFDTLSHVIEIWLLYAPMGFAFASASRTRSRGGLAACLASLIIAVPVECGQHWMVGRYPDVTDIAMSVAGAWLGAWLATGGALMFADLVSEIGQGVEFTS
ncbi:MAG TPA: VanZ family protein, partial [Vicinamibacterales bacterium]|nr:VanZ family protein [Vicinamibacterales bacterium]